MKTIAVLLVSALLTSCATMNDSLQLGAVMGAIAGGGTTYAARSTTGANTSFGDVALGAGIGMGVGLLTSYFTHKSVEDQRLSCQADQTEMHFGDLPPSPFIVPKTLPKKGGQR